MRTTTKAIIMMGKEAGYVQCCKQLDRYSNGINRLYFLRELRCFSEMLEILDQSVEEMTAGSVNSSTRPGPSLVRTIPEMFQSARNQRSLNTLLSIMDSPPIPSCPRHTEETVEPIQLCHKERFRKSFTPLTLILHTSSPRCHTLLHSTRCLC